MAWQTDEGAVGLERVEIHWDVIHAGREQTSGGAAGLVGFEFVAIEHAAASLNDVGDGRARFQQLDAGIAHAA